MKRWARRLLAAAAGILVSLLLIEAGCKIVDVVAQWRDQRTIRGISRVSTIPGVRYELIENVVSKTPGIDIPIRVNNLGFRGPDVSPAKPVGVYRIVLLGDSIAFGRTLPDERIFARLLERRLNRDAGPRRFEVVNASLSGRDTWEHAALLRHRVLALDPDLVILQICLNDHVRLPFPDPDTMLGVFGEQAWYQYSSLLALLDRRVPGFREWHVGWIRRLGLESTALDRAILDHYIDARQMLDVEPHWREWSEALLEIRDLARSNGAEVLFAVFPLRFQVKHRAEHTLPILTEFAAGHDIPLVDLVQAYSRHPVAEVLRDYTHPNAKGNRVAARALERFIRRRFLSGPEAPRISGGP